MKHYLLHYVDCCGDSLFYRCQADDYAHAVEQLEDAERHQGRVAFVELYKESTR